MRAMRFMTRDWQSGGIVAVFLALCLLLQGAATAVAGSRAAIGDEPVILCLPVALTGVVDIDGHGKATPHDCCPGICHAPCCASPPAAPALGKAFGAAVVLPVSPPGGAPPPRQALRNAIQARAPPVSI